MYVHNSHKRLQLVSSVFKSIMYYTKMWCGHLATSYVAIFQLLIIIYDVTRNCTYSYMSP